jgi:hypothetical protein
VSPSRSKRPKSGHDTRRNTRLVRWIHAESVTRSHYAGRGSRRNAQSDGRTDSRVVDGEDVALAQERRGTAEASRPTALVAGTARRSWCGRTLAARARVLYPASWMEMPDAGEE